MSEAALEQDMEDTEDVQVEDALSILDMSDEDYALLSDEERVLGKSIALSESPETDSSTEEDESVDNAEDDEGDDDINATEETPDVDSEAELDPDSGKPVEESAEEKAAINADAELKKLLAPFRANGKDMKVDNVDDALKLMKMGANYNLKMSAMKPGLKVLKMLEKNGLMDEEKLSYLIDLDQQNPAAIRKLLKESKLDPMDLAFDEDDKAPEYQAPNRSTSDSELELEAVIEELRTTPTYSKTLQVVSSTWDEPSKQIVADQPNLLRVINDHIASGIYDLVSTEVERERMFGRIDASVSDIEAYRMMGDKMEERGVFKHLGATAPSTAQTTTGKPDAIKKAADDETRRANRKAAGPTKPAISPKTSADDFNPLSMSDEDWMKQADPRLM